MPFYHLSFLRIIYRSCCQYLNWSSQVIRRFFCLFSLIVVGGFYFYIDLLDNYLAIDDESGDRFGLHDEIFNWFFIATVGAVIVAISVYSAVKNEERFVQFSSLSVRL